MEWHQEVGMELVCGVMCVLRGRKPGAPQHFQYSACGGDCAEGIYKQAQNRHDNGRGQRLVSGKPSINDSRRYGANEPKRQK